jgi:uncharacterized SAM-binding protein YcdF (DUF218 family)
LNSLFVLLGIESWKPALSALALPPTPLLLLILVGAWRAVRRRRLGVTLIVAGTALLWLSHCAGTGYWLSRWLLEPPPALAGERIAGLRGEPRDRVAIVVLGGGADPVAPEYGSANLVPASVERLRYALWLARATGLPVAFSGGAGWGQNGTQVEAQLAERMARDEFGQSLRWAETASRDTRENAVHSVALLRAAGIKHLVIVTHGWHMPRALRAFRLAAAGQLTIEAAPMGLAPAVQLPRLAWLPSIEGHTHVRRVLHEALGLLMGA